MLFAALSASTSAEVMAGCHWQPDINTSLVPVPTRFEGSCQRIGCPDRWRARLLCDLQSRVSELHLGMHSIVVQQRPQLLRQTVHLDIHDAKLVQGVPPAQTTQSYGRTPTSGQQAPLCRSVVKGKASDYLTLPDVPEAFRMRQLP